MSDIGEAMPEPSSTSSSLNSLWGRFSIFSDNASANSILANVVLAAYHLGCLLEVSQLYYS